MERSCSTLERKWPIGDVFALLPEFGYLQHGTGTKFVLFVERAALNTPLEGRSVASFWVGGETLSEDDIRVALARTNIDPDEFLAALEERG